jgi:predicted small secreted protein
MSRILALIGLVATLSACETVDGFGRDVAIAGEEIQESANEAQY